MKLFRSVLPNLTISLNIALMIVIYLDMRNPMMGFLIGAPFITLAASCCICSILTAAVLYGSWRRMNWKQAEQSNAKQ
jgi:hypothetical protein